MVYAKIEFMDKIDTDPPYEWVTAKSKLQAIDGAMYQKICSHGKEVTIAGRVDWNWLVALLSRMRKLARLR